jgi:hypothetical protein
MKESCIHVHLFCLRSNVAVRDIITVTKVIFSTGEIYHQVHSFDLGIRYLSYKIHLLLNTHLLPTIFVPLGNLTKSHVSFLYNNSISSSMESFQSLPSNESTASPTDLGSSSMEVSTNLD